MHLISYGPVVLVLNGVMVCVSAFGTVKRNISNLLRQAMQNIVSLQLYSPVCYLGVQLESA